MSVAADVGVSVIIVNFNGGDDLTQCLRSLQFQVEAVEVVIVDNASSDGSIEKARREFPDFVTVLSPVNVGFARAANLGASCSKGKILLFLNPDTRLEIGCVAALKAALLGRMGVAGPVLTVEASGADEYGWSTNRLGMPRASLAPAKPLFVPGCALATNRSTFDAIGGFDARYFLFVEDLEYCWRVLIAGQDVQVVGSARAWHRGGGSAPGGYTGSPTYQTSEMRVILRERNTLAAMLSCARGRMMPFVIPACVLRSLVIAIVSLAIRRPRLARSLLAGICWNVVNFPATVRRRRSLRRDPWGVAEAERRLVSGSFLLETLRDHGMPRFVPDRR